MIVIGLTLLTYSPDRDGVQGATVLHCRRPGEVIGVPRGNKSGGPQRSCSATTDCTTDVVLFAIVSCLVNGGDVTSMFKTLVEKLLTNLRNGNRYNMEIFFASLK